MARKPSDRQHGDEMEAPELNLAPIMALIVLLIPVLLFAFSFFQIKVQAVAAPRMGSGSAKKADEDEKKPLNLTVLISSTGFALKQQAELTAEPEPPIPKRTFEFKGKELVTYDYPALYTRLAEKKKAYPDEKTINIGAEMNIPWHVLVRTIDAARSSLEKDAYESMNDYAEAEVKKGSDKKPVEMFPLVVFVVAE